MSEDNKSPEPEFREVNITCNRSRDRKGIGQCDSIRAFIVGGSNGRTQYRCVKCNYTWAISVGGSFNI
jgi:transposase-like protein